MKLVSPLRAAILALVMALVESAGEADYTLDDSFWNEESPVGEVERLLKEHQQNQELVHKIGSNIYQIIYPVQLRHHEKMGISTREVGAPKFPGRGGFDSSYSGSGASRGRSRTGKHFHRTSLLIKAFNHKFRLDLELNTQLLAPNIVQKHYLPSGFAQDSHREIEHCYYHGTVKDYPGASAAFHTCNGVSGVIHVGNETFVIHPFYGGDLSKHPHVIFEARTKSNKGCANSGNMENWARHQRNQRQNHHSGLVADQQDANGAGRYRRDVSETTKYIETALVIDRSMFQKRNGSTRAEVVHDAIQVANIADLYFRTVNTRVSVVYIETWQGLNQAKIDGGQDISKAISNFNDYTTRNLYKIDKDTTQLLTGETFAGGEAGMAVPDSACTAKAVGISVDINTYEPHLLAGTMAHMIGHNIGMSHDVPRDGCSCRDWHGCIMSQTIVGLENVQPYKFSECSEIDYTVALRHGNGLCLFNKPNEVVFRKNCGNGVVEEDEECDCGNALDCDKTDPCCDGITCKLKKESQCATGPCCDKCILKPPGVICRDAHNECDLPEYCNGETGQCPPDVHKKNGNPCGMNTSGLTTGYCFNGLCPTTAAQCERIWGYSGTGADRVCYEQFNSKGSINGHCGKDASGNYIKCEPENIQCGSLQCKDGDRTPVEDCSDHQYAKAIISIKGVEYECKSISGSSTGSATPPFGLVRDGTPCGDNLICVNQSCVSIFPYIDQTKCPSNHNNLECSGNGDCTNTNKCFCKFGWTGPDCSIQAHITTTYASPVTSSTPESLAGVMEKKTTRYANYHGSNTVFLVGVLMSVVGGVFVTFALMALCYRKKTTRLKYDPPYVKKPMAKYVTNNANHHSQEDISPDDPNKLMYGNQMHHRDHKSIRRLTGASGSEEDAAHSGEEETVSFIDLPPNNTSKLPEKGILKKHGFGLVLVDSNKEKWPDDTQSDNLELIAQQESTIPPSGGQTGAAVVGPVPDGMKFVNGYHEDILEALRRSAAQVPRSSANTPSGSFSEELLRKTLADCVSNMQIQNTPNVYPAERDYQRGSSSRTGSKENVCVPHPLLSDTATTSAMIPHHRQQQRPQDEDHEPLRIRNLEDLIRQLEHHSSRHMSPNGSEDTRVSETEMERHYRVDSSAPCSESSHGSNQQLAQSQKTATILPPYSSRCRPPRSDDESRFSYGGGGGGGPGSSGTGRYRHSTSRHPAHQPHSPHSFSHHTHHGHAHGHSSHAGHSSHHSSHTHLHDGDGEGIYESADPHPVHPHPHDRNALSDQRDTNDSESDDLFQAQQQLARWASEDVVSVVVMEQGSDSSHAQGPSSASTMHGHIQQHPSHQQQQLHHDNNNTTTITTTSNVNGVPAMGSCHNITNLSHQLVNSRDYYPSPPSTETESSGSVVQPSRRGPIMQGQGPDGNHIMENTGRYPEYKH
ncbi:disintegrin and metalloproteinase domain-containing protein 30 isoform X9 [Aedes aegypti]|uniref:MIND-MELD/ADAM n=1 Tax=Aedes aegypti TaxID=7159 RepID=A0A903TP33_AEDAE|nr:disintegrin and metalloproteinase domain-containing protein 30 isoform X9 [Aedes aegypti]